MNALTEAEATMKWCPDARRRHLEASSNRDAGGTFNQDAACIASRCMAWRWLKGSEQAGTGRGYCGRAGRP